MKSVMKGADIPIYITEIPQGLTIKRLDFSQKDKIVITKMGEDFTVDGDEAYTTLSQEETLRLDDKRNVDIQLSYEMNGLVNRTPIVKVNPNKIIFKGVV